jgi:two-component system cell cycle response regulator DivK
MGTRSTSKHILVVEDQEDNRQILHDLLGHAGYRLTEAGSGEDLILMDLRLPVLDGYQVTRRIKSDPALRSIPIIAVTAYALHGDEDRGQEAGCDAYVTKPYCPRQLLMKIEEFLH